MAKLFWVKRYDIRIVGRKYILIAAEILPLRVMVPDICHNNKTAYN